MASDPTAISAVALLEERVRRAVYEAVVDARRPLSRDEAAAAVGVSRSLAAFHLDRLVAAGLLTPEYRRLTGRTGPGAGRPAKLYRRAEREVAVSLPERRYDVAARILATTLDAAAGEVPPTSLSNAARDLGRSAGARARRAAGPRAGHKRVQDRLMAALREQGYAPVETADGLIRLGNCPFDALVADHRQLVCGMNQALLEGLVEGLGEAGYIVRSDPQPGWCCVAIDRAAHAGRKPARRASQLPGPAEVQPQDG